MKKILSFGILVFALSCKTESDVEPATGSFFRYFGSDKNHTAVLALQADNGFTMLSNVEVQTAADIGYKIKMIHTDLNGNFLWEQSFPAYITGDDVDQDNTMTAASFIPLANSGYLIIGDKIKVTDGITTTDLLLLYLDQDGKMISSMTIKASDLDINPALYEGASLHGRAVMQSGDETNPSYTVLGSISPTTNNTNMFVAHINAADLTLGWTREYGSAESTLINKLYTTSANQIFWGGSVDNYGQKDIRLIRVGEDSEGFTFGDPLTSIDKNEVAEDMCQTAGGWAITGSTTEGDGDENVYLMKVSPSSELVYYKNFGSNEDTLTGKQVDFGFNDKGNSICGGTDGGLVILATVESTATQQDMYLIKVDALSGNILWTNSFGGADRDDGASIRPLADGSYLVFGTSYFGRVKKLVLMKVNKNGTL